jgi:hypothetical protein
VLTLLLERIQEVREETIKNLLDLPYGILDQYESTIAGICCQRAGREGCDAAVYGSIARGLQKAGLWPRKRAKDIHMSAKELAAKVGDIQIYYYANSHYENHYGCGAPNFRQQITNILSAVPSPALELHRQHMEAQK